MEAARANGDESVGNGDPTPAQLGLSMPPEWEPHTATWTSWPFDDQLWLGYLEGVRREFAALVTTIARFEPVVLNVRDDEAEADARRRLAAAGCELGQVRFHRLALNDVWFRDNGPLFVRGPAESAAAEPTGGAHAAGGANGASSFGRVSLTDWRFNAWGGKYAPWDDDDRAPATVARTLGMRRFAVPLVMEGGALEVNGRGVCLTTRSCLLNPSRNPGLDEADLEQALGEQLGVKRVVWLEQGLEGDHTDGHIDTIARFTNDHTIVCCVEENPRDPNHATMAANFAQLLGLRNEWGERYQVIELPLPRRRFELDGQRLPPTYANFYVGNGFVVVPVYDDPNDQPALEILRPLFPGRQVIGLKAVNLITGGGAFHCVTQQQPMGEVELA